MLGMRKNSGATKCFDSGKRNKSANEVKRKNPPPRQRVSHDLKMKYNLM
jgi:hypothetical protein